VIIVALSAGARLYRLEADPPPQIVPGYVDDAFLRDEPAKAHEARNKALFGKWKLSEADEYGFWRRHSPVWVYGQYLWFTLFGVSYASARAYVVLYGIAGIGLLFALTATHYGVLAAVFASVLLSFNFAYLQYTRLALMEPALIFFLLASTCALAVAERRPERTRALVPVSAMFLLAASLTKPTGLLFVPLVAAWALSIVYRRFAPARSMRTRLVQVVRSPEGQTVLATFGGVAAVLAALLADPGYSQRIAFHLAEYVTRPQESSFWNGIGKGLVKSLTGPKIPDIVRYLAPVSLALTLGEIVRLWLVRGRTQGRPIGPVTRPSAGPGPAGGAPCPRLSLAAPIEPLGAYMLAWFAVALIANLLVEHHQVHLQLILFPPMTMLGGLFAARLWHSTAIAGVLGRRLLRGVVVAAAIAFAAYHGQRYLDWITRPTFTFPESSRALARLIGEREAVVVGEFAAQAVLETRYRHFYVRPGLFNSSERTLMALGITHLVAHEHDFVTEVLRRNAPQLLNGSAWLGKIGFYGLTLHVYRLGPIRPLSEESPPRALGVPRGAQRVMISYSSLCSPGTL
jgi:hypothetical protein